jgi:hypothetical protein
VLRYPFPQHQYSHSQKSFQRTATPLDRPTRFQLFTTPDICPGSIPAPTGGVSVQLPIGSQQLDNINASPANFDIFTSVALLCAHIDPKSIFLRRETSDATIRYPYISVTPQTHQYAKTMLISDQVSFAPADVHFALSAEHLHSREKSFHKYEEQHRLLSPHTCNHVPSPVLY